MSASLQVKALFGSRSFQWAFSLLLTVGLIWLVFRGIEFEVILEFGRAIPLGILIAAFGFYALMNVLRALRFRILFKEVGLRELIGVSFVHNLANNVLPFRIGELSFVFLMRKHAGYDRTLTSLVVLRVLDLAVIAGIFVIAALSLSGMETNLRFYGAAVIGISLLAGLCLVVFRRIPRGRMPAFFWKFQTALDEFTVPLVIRSIFWTAMVWTSSLFVFFLLCDGMNVGVGWLALCIPITLVRLSNVLPVSGFAGFGTTEGTWVLGALAVGVDLEAAAATGLIVHVLRLSYTVILGGVGWLLLRR